ncbi:hypothetical protein NZD89_03875 [Alicyclobacillus fastidiosus]|uniref:Uncharacterized protein n=1 Tax=Alicyclobacillus fastidiosus TaxID=392011 RepID=A0ABY6ZL12_9BACL|nr:hypothetical protein [Alicyclobacillus fastidiosus]WAH42605.1 hypothetical protein NZD89_03875 [Alicyclobacillus fastidiosus]GMA64471.1 hypothetical protein GCM10025859_49110 [Alicyclobacillus fastidiosus]
MPPSPDKGHLPLPGGLSSSPEEDVDFSPYGFSVDLTVTNHLAKEIGFAFTDWRLELPSMIGQVLERKVE